MPALEKMSQSESEKINDALLVSMYSYPDQDLVSAQYQNSQHSEKNLLFEYMWRLLLNVHSSALQSKIKDMSKLSANWNTYDADPPAREALDLARELLILMEKRGFLPTDAVASAEGGVGLSFTIEDRYADIECLNSGEILAFTVAGQQEPVVWEVEKNNEGFIRAVERIYDHISP